MGDQYAAQGVVFDNDVALTGIPCTSMVFYRDTANAHSQPNVAYSYCQTNELLSSYAAIQGQLTTSSDAVSVYAGDAGASFTQATTWRATT